MWEYFKKPNTRWRLNIENSKIRAKNRTQLIVFYAFFKYKMTIWANPSLLIQWSWKQLHYGWPILSAITWAIKDKIWFLTQESKKNNKINNLIKWINENNEWTRNQVIQYKNKRKFFENAKCSHFFQSTSFFNSK